MLDMVSLENKLAKIEREFAEGHSATLATLLDALSDALHATGEKSDAAEYFRSAARAAVRKQLASARQEYNAGLRLLGKGE
jgi:predicted DNA-binding ribbon-helix-helix protein